VHAHTHSAARRIPAALLAIAITALLVWFGNGLNPRWLLMWFAPLPALLFAARSPNALAAAGVAFAGWFLGTIDLYHYLHTVQGVPISVPMEIAAGFAFVFTIAVLLFRALFVRRSYTAALIVFPATWVSFEFLLNLISVHGTGGNLAYTQIKLLPLLQIASLTGPWGITFLLLLFPSALATAIFTRTTRTTRAPLFAFALITAALIFGAIRLAIPDPGPRITVGLIASNSNADSDVASPGAPAQKLLAAYAAQAQQLIAQGAQIVVLPEKIAVAINAPDGTNSPDSPNAQSAADTRAANEIFQSLADSTNTTIVVGLIDVATSIAPPLKYNRARLFTPHAPMRTYDKHHMLPPFESNLTPGTTLTLVPHPAAPTWGVAICKDMDFETLSRSYGRAGAGLMLVPAWDFNIDRAWHGHMAIMRGVENGFSIARAAKQGFLTVSDSRGRVLAETETNPAAAAPFATLLAQVPTSHHATLFSLVGNWFAFVVLALFAFSLLSLFTTNPK
jgi:apolipoprotein N-acyltransferase